MHRTQCHFYNLEKKDTRREASVAGCLEAVDLVCFDWLRPTFVYTFSTFTVIKSTLPCCFSHPFKHKHAGIGRSHSGRRPAKVALL